MKGYPTRYVVFDTETSERQATRKGWHKEQTLRLGVCKIYDPVVYKKVTPLYANFTTAAEFQDILDQMPRTDVPIYLFAHNIGFDLRIVAWFRYVTKGRYSLMPPAGMKGEGRYKTPLFVLDGHPVLMRFFRDDGQIFHLWDSFNWFPYRLAELGKWLEYPKGEIDFKTCTEEELFEYCQTDVDLLDRALRHLWGWLQCIRVSDWGATPAGQAASLYRMRYGKGRIKRVEDHTLTDLDRMAYYGGLVEPFYVGRYEGQCYQVDCNGMYPHVMAHNLYPCEVIDHGESPPGGALEPIERPEECTAEVWIESPAAVWPVRTRLGTYHFRGRVHTVLCGPELAEAYRAGVVVRHGRWVRFRRDDLFSGFVDTFWRLRVRAKQRGDEIIQHTCKHLLNSLHGKFGQRDGEWRYLGRTETPGYYGCGKVIRPDSDQDTEARVLDGHMFHRQRDEEHDQSFVPIAAWTASYARVYMAQVVGAVGAGAALYQCCDSLILTQDGFDRLHSMGMLDTGRLGDFKTEDSFKWVHIWGPNQIDHCHGWKHAGVKSGSAAIADGIYEVEEWEGSAASIFAGNVSSAFTRVTPVRPSRSYSRRYVNADGSTVPIAVDNWHVPLSRLSSWSPDERHSGRE